MSWQDEMEELNLYTKYSITDKLRNLLRHICLEFMRQYIE